MKVEVESVLLVEHVEVRESDFDRDHYDSYCDYCFKPSSTFHL